MGGPAVVLLTLEVCVESNIRHAGQDLRQRFPGRPLEGFQQDGTMLGFSAAAIGGRTLFQGMYQGFIQSPDQQACHGHLQAGIPRTSPVLHTGAQTRTGA